MNLKKGDLIVRHGKVLKVSLIEKDSIDLQPFFESQASNGLTFTINVSQINDGYIRKLPNKAEVKKMIKEINKKQASGAKLPAFDIKTALTQNKLEDTLAIIKTLSIIKEENDGVLMGGKLTTYRLAMRQATNEIAAVNDISIENAETFLRKSLKIKPKTK